MTLAEALAFANKTLQEGGLEDADSDAVWILCDLWGCSRAALLTRREEALTPAQREALQEMLSRRLAGEPLQYILGTQSFMGFSFAVDPRVLIPRPETELLCEAAVRFLGDRPARVLDLCTGSGCLAVSIQRLCPQAEVWASDLSGEALAVARHNAKALGAGVRFCQGDLLAPFQGKSFDLIVSNPPYVSQKEMEELSREVRREPQMALAGGPDGLDFYRRIARDAPACLGRPGVLMLEVGWEQAQQVASLLQEAGAETACYQDLRGVPRFVHGIWREEERA